MTKPASYPDDPDAPYFEHLFAAAQKLQPGISRAEALALLRECDPDDTLRISDPMDGGEGQCDRCAGTHYCPAPGTQPPPPVMWNPGRGRCSACGSHHCGPGPIEEVR